MEFHFITYDKKRIITVYCIIVMLYLKFNDKQIEPMEKSTKV